MAGAAATLAPVIEALRQPEVIFAFQLTLSVAFWAVLINTGFGIVISLLLARYTFPGRRALSALIDLPLAVSPIVVGLALLLVYSGRTGWLGRTLESAGLQIIYAPPGMIMATAGLLKDNPNPTDEEIYRGLEGNLCRCTGYINIVKAVKRSAKLLRK